MLAVGCLIPLVLLVAGGAAGWAIAGQHGEFIGGASGAAIGVAAMIALAWGWERIRNRGPS